ncbi:hypothetical protein CVT26_011893, partial [Gymnopilus dilepis]
MDTVSRNRVDIPTLHLSTTNSILAAMDHTNLTAPAGPNSSNNLHPPTTGHKLPRRDCRYTPEEVAAIIAYKDAFVNAKSVPDRIGILKCDIGPAMFSYWKQKGKVPRTITEMQEWTKLTIWCSNNWRSRKSLARKSNGFKPNRYEVIWFDRRKEVLKEIAVLMNMDKVTTHTKGWFQHRIKAITQMIENMDDIAKQALNERMRDIEKQGYPEALKRKYASKYDKKRIRDSMDLHYKEMGLIGLHFWSFHDIKQNGIRVVDCPRKFAKITFESVDYTPKYLGVNVKPFHEVYADEIADLKYKFSTYIKTLEAHREIPGLPRSMIPNGPPVGAAGTVFEKTAEGFPILPKPLPIIDKGKKDLEEFYNRYMSDHYALATGGKYTIAPWTDMTKDVHGVIDRKYIPKDVRLTNPRNTKKQAIEDLFEHILLRQEKHGPEDAFRFKGFRKGNEIVPTVYPGQIRAPTTRRASRKSRGSKKTAPTGVEAQAAQMAQSSRQQDTQPEVPLATTTPEVVLPPAVPASPDSRAIQDVALIAPPGDSNAAQDARIVIDHDVAQTLGRLGIDVGHPVGHTMNNIPQYSIARGSLEQVLYLVSQQNSTQTGQGSPALVRTMIPQEVNQPTSLPILPTPTATATPSSSRAPSI